MVCSLTHRLVQLPLDPVPLQLPHGDDGAEVLAPTQGRRRPPPLVHAVVDALRQRDLGQVAEQDQVAHQDVGAALGLALALLKLQLIELTLYVLL